MTNNKAEDLREQMRGILFHVAGGISDMANVEIGQINSLFADYFLSLLPEKRTVQLIDGLFTNEHEVNGFNDAIDIMRQRIEGKS